MDGPAGASAASDDIVGRIGDLGHELKALSDRLAQAAAEIANDGRPPVPDLADAIKSVHEHFVAARTELLRVVTELAMPLDVSDDLVSLSDLESLALAVADAQHKSATDSVRSRVQGVLDEIISLSHQGEVDFGPLRDVQGRARQLRPLVESLPAQVASDELRLLAEEQHPFNHLLEWIHCRDDLDDERWEELNEAVGAAFGHRMATAISVPPQSGAVEAAARVRQGSRPPERRAP